MLCRCFSSCGEWGLLSSCVFRLLTAVPSLVVGHAGFSSCSTCGKRAQLLQGMCNLPGPGIKPTSLALAGRFFTTEPPGKPLRLHFELRDDQSVFLFTPVHHSTPRWSPSHGCATVQENLLLETSLAVQWLRLHTFNTEDPG